MRSRTRAVGVGFLLNSISSVDSWSCVARCLFWFFCCCVRVLFRGGRPEADEERPAEAGVEGEGVCELLLPAVELGVGRALEMEVPGVGGASESGRSALTLTSVSISGD